MNNKLIASLAAGALLSGVSFGIPSAFAQETTTPQTMETQPLTTTGEQPADSTGTMPGTGSVAADGTAPGVGSYLTQQGPTDIAASTYIGQTVYSAADENVGSITDVIFSDNGGVRAAIIGVGGFLGLGEKNVAVPLDRINVQQTADSDELRLTTTETAETLRAAPEFVLKAEMANDTAPVDGSTTSSTGTGTMGTTPEMTNPPATTTEPAPVQ